MDGEEETRVVVMFCVGCHSQNLVAIVVGEKPFEVQLFCRPCKVAVGPRLLGGDNAHRFFVKYQGN